MDRLEYEIRELLLMRHYFRKSIELIDKRLKTLSKKTGRKIDLEGATIE